MKNALLLQLYFDKFKNSVRNAQGWILRMFCIACVTNLSIKLTLTVDGLCVYTVTPYSRLQVQISYAYTKLNIIDKMFVYVVKFASQWIKRIFNNMFSMFCIYTNFYKNIFDKIASPGY